MLLVPGHRQSPAVRPSLGQLLQEPSTAIQSQFFTTHPHIPSLHHIAAPPSPPQPTRHRTHTCRFQRSSLPKQPSKLPTILTPPDYQTPSRLPSTSLQHLSPSSTTLSPSPPPLRLPPIPLFHTGTTPAPSTQSTPPPSCTTFSPSPHPFPSAASEVPVPSPIAAYSIVCRQLTP